MKKAMSDYRDDCIICRGAAGDEELRRVEVWHDRSWRLTVSLETEVRGFAYLEPKRHIPTVTDLDGEEAQSLGEVLAEVTRTLREATEADAVYVYIFGTGVPHLHLHLAPHREGDALSSQIIKGKVRPEKLPTGAVRYVSDEFPLLPGGELRRIAETVRERLSSQQ